MAKTVRRKKPSLSLVARRANQFAWESADDPEAGRLEKVYNAVANRMKAKKEGQKAAVLIAKARKAKTRKAFRTADAKIANAESNRMKKMATGRKISKAMGGGTEVIVDGRKKPITFTAGARKSKYTAKQLREIPYLEKQAQRWAAASKASARQSGGVSTGIKRTAEAAIGRIATGKALKGMARAGGVLGIAALFNAALKGNDSKKKRG